MIVSGFAMFFDGHVAVVDIIEQFVWSSCRRT